MADRASDRPGRSPRTPDHDARARLRAGVRPITLLRPEHVPSGPTPLVGADPHVHATLLRLHHGVGQSLRAGWPLDGAIAEALAALPSHAAAARCGAISTADPDPACAAIDHGLCITRVLPPLGLAGDLYARGITAALGTYEYELHNLGTGGDARRWRAIGQALHGLLGRYLHLPPDLAPGPAWEARLHGQAADPLRRWVHGRQISAVLAQGVIWALHAFDHARTQGRHGGAESALELAADVLDARACAAWYTTDFEVRGDDLTIGAIVRGMPLAGTPSSFDDDHLAALLARLLDGPAGSGIRHAWPGAHANLKAARERVNGAWRAVRERLAARVSASDVVLPQD